MKARLISLFTVSFCLMSTACGGLQESVSETKLIGGIATDPLTSSNIYPATVMIGKVKCSGVKIGPKRFMTAAHCVNPDVTTLPPVEAELATNTIGLTPQFQPGATINISNSKYPSLNLNVSNKLTIKATYLNPAWGNGCPDPANCDVNTSIRNGPDIAVFDVKEESPDIPIATVDTSRVYAGDRVVITGYGCEWDISDDDLLSFTRRFKYQVTEARTVVEVRRVVSVDVGNAFDWGIVTPGISTEPTSASLCPGDSGGPLYRDDGTQLTLVGINSYNDFLERDTRGTSAFNWHARLEKIQAWLASLPPG